MSQFWKVARTEKDSSELKSSSVGFSMSLERMVALFKKMDEEPSEIRKLDVSTVVK